MRTGASNDPAWLDSIPPHLLEQIRAANDIVDVIGSYLPLKRAGANFPRALPVSSREVPQLQRQSAPPDF